MNISDTGMLGNYISNDLDARQEEVYGYKGN